MKKKSLTLLLVAAVSGSLMFSSCIGSFGLSKKVLTWNQNIDNKFVNELVFILCWPIPVYPISILADIFVLNTIEFWSGSNPVADAGSVQKIEGKDGIYTVETKVNGYHIEKEGEAESVDLVFDENSQTWSAERDGQSQKLVTFEGDDEVVMHLPDGQTMNVTLDEAGVMAFRQVVEGFSYYAAR